MFKLSAEDIVQQTFQKCFRGYDPDQVEEFLTAVAREWEYMRSELERARDEAADKAEQLEEYEEREERLYEALETAKRAADDIREEAEREAERKIAEAEVEADRILSNVEQDVQQLQEDIRRLREQRNRYRTELKALLESHLEMVEEMEDVPRSEAISRSPSLPDADAENGSCGPDSPDDDAAGASQESPAAP